MLTKPHFAVKSNWMFDFTCSSVTALFKRQRCDLFDVIGSRRRSLMVPELITMIKKEEKKNEWKKREFQLKVVAAVGDLNGAGLWERLRNHGVVTGARNRWKDAPFVNDGQRRGWRWRRRVLDTGGGASGGGLSCSVLLGSFAFILSRPVHWTVIG